ncbi:MAG TPA: hypothetical protein VK804_04165 [Bradyrhizobium sp.]|jgi:hypothetical protein|uniref:hypothetical protein n=1 Tax=Bradyrhizobium sp. TaxID=376 RepID=UPI002C374371|nr:hypothetical protein [Bradyrhizobium sp.]HTA99649.1 hypothetical protein [Bradyrhizobium sp.]
MNNDAEIVATGTWLYDQQVPRPISVLRKPAKWAHSRYDWETDQWDESRPIPDTVDGFLYYCSLGKSGEHLSINDAKAWADAQPWGPVNWSSESERHRL